MASQAQSSLHQRWFVASQQAQSTFKRWFWASRQAQSTLIPGVPTGTVNFSTLIRCWCRCDVDFFNEDLPKISLTPNITPLKINVEKQTNVETNCRGYSCFQAEPTIKEFVTWFAPVLVSIHFHLGIYLIVLWDKLPN